MLARYFDGPVDPAASLLGLGAAQGFTVWAIDRPGYGASAGVPDERIDIVGQAGLVHLALDAFAREHDIGAGFFVVGHSYGLKLALVMAADARRRQLLGVDGAGTGLRYAIDSRRPPTRVPGERGTMWGPEHLYPPGPSAPATCPRAARDPGLGGCGLARAAALHRGHIRSAPDHLRRPRTPLADRRRLARRAGPCSPFARVEIAIQPGRRGHNVSLSNAAADYHTRARRLRSNVQ
jgi:pimeloyl-ACP methyl ester carboxylesterase